MSEIKGDLIVKRDVSVGRTLDVTKRVGEGFLVYNNVGVNLTLDLNSEKWINVVAGGDVVLPDATTLDNGWEINILNTTGSSLDVVNFSSATVKSIVTGRAYRLTLTDNGGVNGTWYVNYLEEADLLPSSRYSSAFNNTTDWGVLTGGYYTITVAAATHLKGTEPNPKTYELNGSDYIEVMPDRFLIDSSGNVNIRVVGSPDGRFTGKVVIY